MDTGEEYLDETRAMGIFDALGRMPDWFDTEVGVVRQFGGLKAPWTAQLDLSKKVSIGDLAPYVPTTIARKSKIGWNKGSTVLLMDDPQGNTWVMKGFQLGLKPKVTFEQFVKAGQSQFKKLPPGWKFRMNGLPHEIRTVRLGALVSELLLVLHRADLPKG